MDRHQFPQSATPNAAGVNQDQPRSIYWSAACGSEASGDFAAIRQQIKGPEDFSPAFEATARRREARAVAAEQAGQPVTARDNYFMAAVHWGAAQWPIFEANELNRFYSGKKRDCYTKFAKLAAHRVEEVSIPFQGTALPALFHLPPGYSGGRIPAVVAVTGMDNFKEAIVALYGDRFLSRGFAVLAIEGPGQYECPLLGIYMTVPGWAATGTACVDWLSQRPEVDPERIALSGISFGSFAGTIAAAHEPRFRACAVMNTCLQPGWTATFQDASPSFKKRFMYMANYTDEASFDEFAKTLTWEGHADKIRMPYLAMAGEQDELSPLQYAEDLMKVLRGPRQLVVYEGARHGIAGVPSANLGPFPPTLMADWIAARLRGDDLTSERWFVDATGAVTKTPL